MKIFAALFVTLVTSTSYAASGAAAVVARAAGKSYSEPVRQEFLQGCLEGVEAPVCECVLKKLESKYDENQFKNLETLLSHGISERDYENFIVNATLECGSSVDGAAAGESPLKASTPNGGETRPLPPSVNAKDIGGFQVTDEDLMILKSLLQGSAMKEFFVQTCAASTTEWLGSSQSNKTCSCAYDKLSKDSKAVERILSSENSDLSSFGIWGFEFIEACLPRQFSKEMENAFVKECMKVGDAKKSTCDCVVKTIKKNYTVKSLIKMVFEDSNKLKLELAVKAAQCLGK